MKQYRLYTENTNIHTIRELVDGYLEGYTIYFTEGRWRGKREDSLVIEVLSPVPLDATLENLAEAIKKASKQAEVWIVETEVKLKVV